MKVLYAFVLRHDKKRIKYTVIGCYKIYETIL
jgi:hypothetical protein